MIIYVTKNTYVTLSSCHSKLVNYIIRRQDIFKYLDEESYSVVNFMQ